MSMAMNKDYKGINRNEIVLKNEMAGFLSF